MVNINSFPQLYDYPPLSHIQVPPDHGSSSTSRFHPANPPPVHLVPRHIVEDRQIGPDTLVFARNHLANVGHRPSDGLILRAQEIQIEAAGSFSTARESSVSALLFLVTQFCIRFAIEADGVPAGSIVQQECPQRYRIKPNGRLIRDGQSRVILEYKSKAALDRYANEISHLASLENGQGTELRRFPNETGARSIIFKVSLRSEDIRAILASILLNQCSLVVTS